MENDDPKNPPSLDESKVKEEKTQSPLEESKVNSSSNPISGNIHTSDHYFLSNSKYNPWQNYLPGAQCKIARSASWISKRSRNT